MKSEVQHILSSPTSCLVQQSHANILHMFSLQLNLKEVIASNKFAFTAFCFAHVHSPLHFVSPFEIITFSLQFHALVDNNY